VKPTEAAFLPSKGGVGKARDDMISRIAGFRDDIRTHQAGNALTFEDFTHHSVASAQIDDEVAGTCLQMLG
jgi:hypothetical protein